MSSQGARHLYSVDESTSTSSCLTCSLQMPSSAAPCSYNSVDMSPDLTYYIQDCLGPDVPESVLRFTENGTIVEILEQNDQIRFAFTEKVRL